jgi:hypothetical protein
MGRFLMSDSGWTGGLLDCFFVFFWLNCIPWHRRVISISILLLQASPQILSVLLYPYLRSKTIRFMHVHVIYECTSSP